MGARKALLDAGGTTFLSRTVGSLREGGASPILVVVRDPSAEEGMEALASGGVVIRNPDPAPGSISSLQAGIRALPPEAPGVLFCPVDHPLFLATTVEALCAEFAATSSPITAPTYGGRRGHPVVFSRSLFRELLEDDLPEGARSVIHRYLKARVEVPVNDPGVLADIDTPADYQRHFPR
jgi:molybdenum cofactor cytidylyltransferase